MIIMFIFIVNLGLFCVSEGCVKACYRNKRWLVFIFGLQTVTAEKTQTSSRAELELLFHSETNQRRQVNEKVTAVTQEQKGSESQTWALSFPVKPSFEGHVKSTFTYVLFVKR